MARTVITVAREIASNGELIAAELAQALGIQLLDRQILEAAAAAAGVSAETVSQAERVPGFLDRMLEYLGQHAGGLDPFSGYSTESVVTLTLTTENYRHLIEAVLRKTAQEADAVIVGHGGWVVLRDLPHVFKVRICAPVEVRVQRLQESERLSLQEAQERVHEDDKTRLDYFQTYYKVNWLNPVLYDLCINTTHIGTRTAVEIIRKAHTEVVQA